jgi:hypothetical protein
MGWLDQAAAVIAEVTVPSLGVGYEIAYALHARAIPVLGLCRAGTRLSAMLTGCTHPLFRSPSTTICLPRWWRSIRFLQA